MILILSKAIAEYSTEEVIDWIDFYNVKYLRINGDDLFTQTTSLFLHSSNSNLNSFKISNYLLSELIEDAKVIWFRRWKDAYELFSDKKFMSSMESSILLETYRHVNAERRTVDTFFLNSLKTKPHLSDNITSTPNKIEVLKFAIESGLKIPNTFVTNRREDLINFISDKEDIIVKPLSDAFCVVIPREVMLVTYTNILNKKDVFSLPNNFFTSLFQEYIDKKYEIRSFYLEPNFYSMAIFSQKDEQTKVDFRQYNDNKPNRNIPYKLPTEVENKLRTLMQKLNLKTGSIDLIKSTDNSYVFLEINPVGQFGMTSKPCNYNLEKKIAEYLIKLENEK